MAPKAIAASRELAGLVSPIWDASKRQPFTNLTLADLTASRKHWRVTMASLTRTELERVTRFLRGAAEIPSTELLSKLNSASGCSPASARAREHPRSPLPDAGVAWPAAAPACRTVRKEQSHVHPPHVSRAGHSLPANPRAIVGSPHQLQRRDSPTKHCEENLDAVRAACEELRSRCSEKHPSVANHPG